MQTTTYRSTDGGQNFTAYKGAPGGDDYHVLWIDPQNSQRMILGVDQGATISVDGGSPGALGTISQPASSITSSPTINFPTFPTPRSRIAAPLPFPTAAISAKSVSAIGFPPAALNSVTSLPIPLNPNIVYSGGWYGSVVRFDKITGQITHVFVRSTKYRTSQMPPLVFSPQDPHTLYLGTQYVHENHERRQQLDANQPRPHRSPLPHQTISHMRKPRRRRIVRM